MAQALLQRFKGGQGGVAAPSANRFGHVSPTTAQHVRDEFGAARTRRWPRCSTAAPSEVGIESTIVDLSRLATHGPVLLRPGPHQRRGDRRRDRRTGRAPGGAGAPRASGTLESHYAPRTPVALLERGCVATRWAPAGAGGKRSR